MRLIFPNKTTFIFCLLCFITAFNAHAELKPLDRILVIVNDDVITQTMLDNRIDDFRKQLELSQLSRIPPETLKKQVLERMIRDTIQLQQAKALGITVDDLTLNRALERVAANNNLTLDQFRSTIEGEGMNYSRFRQQTRDELIMQQLQQRVVASKIHVSDQEIKQYIAQNENLKGNSVSYHLRHILIATPEEASSDDIDEARKKAEAIYERIQQGESFEDLAIKESSGRNALNGGDLGERKASELPQIFIDAIQGLKSGEASKPIRSASGYHLLYVVKSSQEQVMVEQTHVRHILIRTSGEVTDDKARQTLLDIKEMLKDGKSFAELASQYSEDPASKITGGDLGWMDPGSFVNTFENVVNDLDIGQISEPFKTQFGWHIIEVLGRREHDQTQANKESQARKAIENRKVDEELRLWLRRIRSEAYVEFVDQEDTSKATDL